MPAMVTPRILKEFIEYDFPGAYVNVLEKGQVSSGDNLSLVKPSDNLLTAHQLFQLLYAKKKDEKILRLLI